MANNHYDVVIVGAGFAGVTAARNLSQKGFKTLVLEGRDRMGGRTWFDNRLGENLEMGGTFIHWFQPNVWHETMRYGVEVEKLIDINKAYWITEGETKEGTQQDEWDLVRAGMKHFGDSEKYFPRPFEPFYNEEAVKEIDHMSVKDRLDEIKPQIGQEVYDVLTAYWCAYFCTDDLSSPALTQAYRWLAMSYNDWDIMEAIFELYKFKGGTKTLLEKIFNDGQAEIKLSTPVTAIEKIDEGHKVTTRDGQEFTATSVIAAIPTNALNSIEWTPALSPEVQAFADENQTTKDGGKLWAKIRGPQVDEPMRLTGPNFASCSLHTQFYNEKTGEAILMGYVSNANRLDVNNREEVQEFLRRWLPEVEVIECTGHVWHEDEFSMGTWSVLRKGQLTKYGKAVRKSRDGLYLASSDYADGWSGFIDGAIENGSAIGEHVTNYLADKVTNQVSDKVSSSL